MPAFTPTPTHSSFLPQDVRVSKTISCSVFSGKTHVVQYSWLRFVTMERHKVRKGTSFQKPFLGSHAGRSSSSSKSYSRQQTARMVQCHPGKLDRLRAPVLLAGWSCRHTLPTTATNTRLPEGKQLLSENPIVCTNRCTEPLSPGRMVGTLLRAKFPAPGF